MSGGTIASAAAHFILKGCTILMARQFGFACRTGMSASTVGPAVDGSVSCAELASTTSSTSIVSATLIAGGGTVVSVVSVGMATAAGLGVLKGLIGQLGLEEAHGLLHLL